MKRILTTAILLLAMIIASLAQPTAITWQGKLLDNNSNAISQNNVAMTFAMFDASTGGNQLWPISGVVTKTVDVNFGLYSVQLGTGISDDIIFTASMFDGKMPWLEVKVGTETLPRTEITNVPFALISNELSAAGWESPGEIGKTTSNTGKFTSLESESLKVTTGASDGKVLTSDAGGNASWQHTKLANFEENNYSYDSKTGVRFKAFNAATNVDIVISPKGTGAILAQQPDGTSTGGNNRGQQAVDFQTSRSINSQVASGGSSVIAGGYSNTVSGGNSAILGGGLNTITGAYSSIGGGRYDTIVGVYNFIGGGAHNHSSGNYSVIAGGYGNLAAPPEWNSFVGGGSYNKATGDFSVSCGGNTNISSGYASFQGSGYANIASGSFSTVTGGRSNTANDGYSTVGGGRGNLASGGYSTIGGGNGNISKGSYSFVGGGVSNQALSYAESVLGLYATIVEGDSMNYQPSDRLFVVGNGTANGSRSNALTILKNAQTTVGGSLTINDNGTNASITFPSGRGISGQFLKTHADGSTSWDHAVEPGTAPGQMQYWNGTEWVTVAAGHNSQILRFIDGVPTWVNDDLIYTLEIGDYYMGGIIAYFLQSGDPAYDANVRHGLIAAPMDQSSNTTWGCWQTPISGADGIALGTGAQNTLDIVAGCSEVGIAARVCNDLELNGYDDWFLPSKEELNKLFLSKDLIGGFENYYYWSSSEDNSDHAWKQWFGSGGYQDSNDKYNWSRVRAVRTF